MKRLMAFYGKLSLPLSLQCDDKAKLLSVNQEGAAHQELLSLLINRKSRFLYPMWMQSGKIWNCNEGNDKIYQVQEKLQKAMVGPGGSWKQRDPSSFQVL
jgi:hypothetical protein